MAKLKIILDGYLKSSHLDKDGAKTIVFEFSGALAVKLAQLELMGRDLHNHLPVLLSVSVEVSGKQKDIPKKKKAIY